MMGFTWQDSWILPLAYALGCVSTGYYLVWWRTGKDVRTLGSGATGARNVARTLGSYGFALTVFPPYYSTLEQEAPAFLGENDERSLFRYH